MAEEPESVDVLFEDAVDALRQGERARGKEILTGLLKVDQNNPNYWVWMSAAVDTAKERIYCLETALKLDPENAVAKRGLILLGGLAPDDNVQPFQVNRPRHWENELLLAHERPKERGAAMSGALGRLVSIGLIGLVAIAVVVAVLYVSPRATQLLRPFSPATAGASPTFTLTPTFVNATVPPSVATRSGPTPLAIVLGLHYTATPLYVNTPRSPLSADTYRSAKQAFDQGNWDEYIRQMEQIQKDEPNAADVPYYIGEAYRLKGDCRTALNYYNQSLQVDSNFAPGYVGLARARICIDPGADTSQLYDLASEADPNYPQTYLDRANFNLVRHDPVAALQDLQKAQQLMPYSALVQLGYAQAFLLNKDNAQGLEAAQKANSIDQTLLPAYLLMGYGYSAEGQYAEAITPLQTYLVYQPKDSSALGLLGQAYVETGDYQAAIDPLQNALKYDPTQVHSLTYLGTANLRVGDLDQAEYYFKRALEYFPDSFDANIGLTEVMYRQGTFGSAYLQAETSKSKATTDTEKALVLYWRALSQEGREAWADARNDWTALLDMPASDMTAEMRQTAEEHLAALVTPTVTPKGGVRTATPTRTPKTGTATPTVAPTPTKTP